MASTEGTPSPGRRLRTLTFTTLFPNEAQPGLGIFIEHRVRQLQASGDVETTVVAPVPWFPSSNGRFQRYARYALAPRSERLGAIPVQHPRYLVLPKIGMNITPLSLALCAVGAVRKQIAQQGGVDLIDAFYLYPDGVAAALIGAMLAMPTVIHGLGTDINVLPDYPLPRRMIRWAADRAAGISTVGQALKDGLCRIGVEGEKIRVIRHGVDLELFRPPADREAERRSLGIAGPAVISVGNLIEDKGHQLVIEALAALDGHRLFIAGEGPMEGALRSLASKLGVAERVDFLGRRPQSELRRYMGAADALVLASKREGIANVLLEAMACGTPVVATDVGGTSEVVTGEAAGLVVRERATPAIAAAIRRLIANPPDRQRTRQHAEQFTWNDTTAAHLALLRDVVSRRDPAGHEA